MPVIDSRLPRRTLLLIAWTAQARLTAASTYVLCVLGASARGRVDGDEPASRALNLVALVPAHDEEPLIADCVASLLAQDYPADRREVIVVADNCGDGTARAAQNAGATAWPRDDPDHPGKGAALTWALGRLWAKRPETDAVVIVDADCLTTPNLLAQLAGALANGADAAQADYTVSNPTASPFSALRAAGFSLKHRVRARGRQRLGLSPGLFGTGMAFSRDLLAQLRWSDSVTEDTELYLRIVEAGLRVAYVGDAAVTSPMPADAEGAQSQQLRWETGNSELMRTRLSRLAWHGVRDRDRERLGAAAELALPSQSAQVAGQVGVLTGAVALRDRRLAVCAMATLGAQAIYVVAGLASAGGIRLLSYGVRALPSFLAKRTRVLTRVSTGHGARAWERTPRSVATEPGVDRTGGT